ncbi:MAG: hypothetical protein ACHQCF_01750 [Solirubrobacterales bacterium]
MSGSERLPPAPRRPSTEVAERLAVIVDAAERAALSVIDDAEAEARRYLEEAQVQADLIVAERLREAADLLEQHRGGAGAELRLRPVGVDPLSSEEEEAEAPLTEEPAPELEPESEIEPEFETEEPEPRANLGSAAARLLATQMAVSGSSRREIAMRLRNGFDIEDTDEILDAILGPEE